MSHDVVLCFNQRKVSDGFLNSIDLSYPSLHGRSPGLVQFEFLHHGVDTLPEPDVLDGYLFGVLQFAMGGAKRLLIKGPLSDKSIRNAHLLSEAWHCWLPEQYKPIEIVPERTLSDEGLLAIHHQRSIHGDAIAAFSGGADSTFTALRHARNLLGNASFKLKALVMVHGFDVAWDNQQDFDELLQRTDPLVQQLGINLHIVRTNIKDKVTHNWEHVFAAQLACVLHQFSHRFSYGLIASGAVLNEPDVRWGSSPQLDYLLSGGDLEIVHDGAGFSRTEKVALIGGNPIARRCVKVCWQGERQGRNCGRCEKCVRTRLNFLAAGFSNPECFDSPFELTMIDTLTVSNIVKLNLLKSIVEDAKKLGTGGAWVTKLHNRIDQLSHSAENSDTSKPKVEMSLKLVHLANRLPLHHIAITNFLRQDESLWLMTEMPGNIGDHLIWAGTERMLSTAGLTLSPMPVREIKELVKQKRPGTLVIPGSSAFVTRWHEWLPDLVIASSRVFERVVILPSSYDPDLAVVRHALEQTNVYPFAREAVSYERIKVFGRAVLAPDPALWAMDFSPIERIHSASHLGDVLLALRTDSGSLLSRFDLQPAKHNNDISLTCENLDDFLNTIRLVQTVVTDRLHIVVAGLMLGKQVHFVDPYDKKISRYVEYNFRDEFSGQLKQHTEGWLADNGYVTPLGVTP